MSTQYICPECGEPVRDDGEPCPECAARPGPTPETDEMEQSLDIREDFHNGYIWLDFARKLERARDAARRERDEARRVLRELIDNRDDKVTGIWLESRASSEALVAERIRPEAPETATRIRRDTRQGDSAITLCGYEEWSTQQDAECDCDKDTERDSGELKHLRAIFPKILEALGNGAFCSPESSIEFLEEIPNEVRLYVARLKAERDPKEPCSP